MWIRALCTYRISISRVTENAQPPRSRMIKRMRDWKKLEALYLIQKSHSHIGCTHIKHMRDKQMERGWIICVYVGIVWQQPTLFTNFRIYMYVLSFEREDRKFRHPRKKEKKNLRYRFISFNHSYMRVNRFLKYPYSKFHISYNKNV